MASLREPGEGLPSDSEQTLKRLDRYLLGEMLLPFVSGVLLIIVMLVGNTLYPLIEQIAKYSIPIW